MIDAKIEEDYCVFYFDTKSITHSLYQIPKNGTYSNTRFDSINILDPVYSIYGYFLDVWVPENNQYGITITKGPGSPYGPYGPTTIIYVYLQASEYPFGQDPNSGYLYLYGDEYKMCGIGSVLTTGRNNSLQICDINTMIIYNNNLLGSGVWKRKVAFDSQLDFNILNSKIYNNIFTNYNITSSKLIIKNNGTVENIQNENVSVGNISIIFDSNNFKIKYDSIYKSYHYSDTYNSLVETGDYIPIIQLPIDVLYLPFSYPSPYFVGKWKSDDFGTSTIEIKSDGNLEKIGGKMPGIYTVKDIVYSSNEYDVEFSYSDKKSGRTFIGMSSNYGLLFRYQEQRIDGIFIELYQKI